jgi:hypothetical protein
MEPQVIIALVIAIPLILFPAAFVWYVNLGGVFKTLREARAARKASKTAVSKNN